MALTRGKDAPEAIGVLATLGARTRVPADATTLLTGFIILLIGIPSRFVFGPLGGAGAPSLILGLGAAFWWLANRVSRQRDGQTFRQPLRVAMLFFTACVLISYIAATTRPIAQTELLSADRGLIIVLAWLGIFSVAMDGIPSRARLDVLLRRVAFAGGAIGTLGLIQFKTGQDWTNYLQLPGLSANGASMGLGERNGVLRPFGTAAHPIEFGVALSMLLPIALHYALVDVHRPLIRRWYPVLALGMAVPTAVSRSAILCCAVIFAFVIPALPRNIRPKAYVVMLISGAFIYLSQPGLIGTLLGLFTGISDDSSAASRTGSYGIAFEFISRAPFFGRGFGTFLPQYHILDNQYLGTMIELGAVGLFALLVLMLSGIATARQIRRLSIDPDTRQLAQFLAAGVAAAATAFALFDAFTFVMIPGLLFLYLGVIGALRRLERPGATPDLPDNDLPTPRAREASV